MHAAGTWEEQLRNQNAMVGVDRLTAAQANSALGDKSLADL